MHRGDRLLTAVSVLLGILLVLNGLCLLLFAGVEALTFLRVGVVAEALRRGAPGADVATAMRSVRLTMILGMAVVPLAHVILSRLRAIVVTVRFADPFIPQNAARLGAIAWAYLGIQLCDLAFGAVAVTSGIREWSGWHLSVSGWLSVLLLFVLAQVFRHGTRMRDELAGTI